MSKDSDVLLSEFKLVLDPRTSALHVVTSCISPKDLEQVFEEFTPDHEGAHGIVALVKQTNQMVKDMFGELEKTSKGL